jgi:ubiquitin-protein ligase E3 B
VNQECRDQFKAFVGGFQSIIPGRCLSFFAPHELQKLMSGENIDFDVNDLRAHTKYEGGYFDQHATIRAFWQVSNNIIAKVRILKLTVEAAQIVHEMSPKEKVRFLYFM